MIHHSHHYFITQYIYLRCTTVNEFYGMIRMGVAGHVRGNQTETDEQRVLQIHELANCHPLTFKGNPK